MPHPPRLALFVTCLVDQILPEIGVATVRLLRRAGYQVEFPTAQTCCGQPFFNSGFWDEARTLARRMIAIFEPYEYVVAPSGSCVSMVRIEFPHLFQDEPEWQARAERLAAKTYELAEFLVHVAHWRPEATEVATTEAEASEGAATGARATEVATTKAEASEGAATEAKATEGATTKAEASEGATTKRVTYHDSCHMNRLLHLQHEPRALLRAAGLAIDEMPESDRCCGFGGLFSVRMPEVSNAMTAEKLHQARATGAPALVTCDPGCLMQMRGLVDDTLRVEHLAVVLERAVSSKG